MNKNNTEKLVIFVAALRLSLDGCSVKALTHYCGGRLILRMIRVAYGGNAPLSCDSLKLDSHHRWRE